ncbi:hypothetical protein EVAR_81782_1 [Eumeta japonica]|uniref:Uncharacterized protein n=1 Tax=Eumeta variegata TaxID=151549 RepID=A0A4C1UHK2_EUMVA|nr:hypothetical protein EVAR_81782_1 [Eumeta japonica]
MEFYEPVARTSASRPTRGGVVRLSRRTIVEGLSSRTQSVDLRTFKHIAFHDYFTNVRVRPSRRVRPSMNYVTRISWCRHSWSGSLTSSPTV